MAGCYVNHRRWSGLAAGMCWLLTGTLFLGLPLRANEKPTKEMIEEYKKDGTLKERIQAAKQKGNHLVDPELAQHFAYKVQKMALEQAGMSPEQIDAELMPPPARRGMPTTGTGKMLVICIDFSDYPHDDTHNSISQVSARIFGTTSDRPAPYDSLRNYYYRSSYSKLTLTGTVLGWYRPSYTRASMSVTGTEAQQAVTRENLIKEALLYYNGGGGGNIDFSQFDNNNDGIIDYFAVIWAGPSGTWSSFWWGYKTSWYSTTSPVLDGKILDDYSWQWETKAGYTWSYPNFDPLVLIHETGHALGLPDYYDYDDSVGPDGGVGGLDMMDGNWGDHNCYSKWMLDWLTPTAVTTTQPGLSLRAASQFGDAVVMMPGASASNAFSEFFMIQNRQRVSGYNDSVSPPYPADGLLIWHVDSRLNAGGTNFAWDNSYTSHKLLRLMEADGLEEIEHGGDANAGDYYISGKHLTPSTLPSDNRYDETPIGMFVDTISAPGDTMTFNVTLLNDSTPPTGMPSTPTDEGATTTSDSLTFTWTNGTASDSESGIAGYYLQVGTTVGGRDVFDGIVGNVFSKTLSGVSQNGKSYYARVRAMNGVGLYSAYSGNSDGIKVVLPTLACSTLDNCNFTFTTSGLFPWVKESTISHFGGSAAASATISDSQSTYLQTTVVGPGVFKFWWKVSSEAIYDWLSFSIDGVVQSGSISGEVDWTQKTFTITTGMHTLRWTYAKDYAEKSGDDAAYVDQVEWTGPACDINGDGVVDVLDILAMTRAFGSTTGSATWNAAADLDKNGAVNSADLTILLASF